MAIMRGFPPEDKKVSKMAKESKTSDIQEKFRTTNQELKAALIERDEEIDMVQTALLCGEHPLLVGPPGTGKSYLLDAFIGWMAEDTCKFQAILTKFSTPEELFGPLSIAGLKNDQFRRITRGMMPETRYAFIDEIFKASSAILNTLLRLLNERVYAFEPGVYQKVPLELCVAASNEWPSDQDGGKELGALFDRFLFRKKVRPIEGTFNRSRLLWESTNPELSTSLSKEELWDARGAASKLVWSQDAVDGLEEIISLLMAEGIRPGDRRMKKSVNAVRCYAWLCGGDSVQKQHLEITKHVLWDDPTEQPEKAAKIICKIANSLSAMIADKLMQVNDIVSKNTVTDAVTKLQELQKDLKSMPSHPRREFAVNHIATVIKQKLRETIGADV
jgi:MoxR-like ATPase